MPRFQLRRPSSLTEAVDMVAAGGTPYCGGTELVAVMRMGLLEPEVLVDLKRVPELDGVEETAHEVVLRARVTHAQAARSPVVRRHARVLAAATSRLGNPRVRATGTLVGNICFAEPRSDVLTALTALDARVDLCSTEGRRSVAVGEFVEAAFLTAREASELVSAVRVPKQTAPAAYVRFQPAEYPTVTVAAIGVGEGCRVVVGAVGDRPATFSFLTLDDVDAAAIAGRIDVTVDLNGSEDYKRHLAAVFVRRAVARLQELSWHA